MSMCATTPAMRRGQCQSAAVSFWLMSILILANLVSSQYSSHCHFNQLCSCRVVPVKNIKQPHQPVTPSTPASSSKVTVNHGGLTYTGQFGVIVPEGATTEPGLASASTPDYEDYEPLFSLGVRSKAQRLPRQSPR